MDRELTERVVMERVEMIARLTTEGVCQERDREIALGLIADIARGNIMKGNGFSVVFSALPVETKMKNMAAIRENSD
ncbi:hypothetical protein EDWATA_00373 [Edwardsiella tarda ATCC 23685]|uniref:Tum protein n=1 Tax=Edwardsiella tarda ATCC 23685 TaxID=500638 RepID=D4F0Z3_EDWTA|nr:hypothetical protein EDWATA_00373 [Edwardsiella tarda ATCC 23685]GAC65010.1 hypothetical protein ET1_14_00640 [Edwardsiella tarda ATCC 15947 = NBRC 105688]